MHVTGLPAAAQQRSCWTTSCAVHAPSTRLHAHTYARTRARPQARTCVDSLASERALHVASRAPHGLRVARVQVFVDVVGLNEALDASDGESDLSDSDHSDEEVRIPCATI
jgi:hypothetical protein